jgi:purine-binding chemotaxis protein CheW
MAVMTDNQQNALQTAEMEYATFYLGYLLMGIDIQQVQEINHLLDITPVPHVPACVAGVVNLRGQVVTVLDLRTILGLKPATITAQTCNVIAGAAGEHIGLIVDRIADVVPVNESQIESPPANICSVDVQFFRGVFKMENKLLMILNIDDMIRHSVAEQQNNQEKD